MPAAEASLPPSSTMARRSAYVLLCSDVSRLTILAVLSMFIPKAKPQDDWRAQHWPWRKGGGEDASWLAHVTGSLLSCML